MARPNHAHEDAYFKNRMASLDTPADEKLCTSEPGSEEARMTARETGPPVGIMIITNGYPTYEVSKDPLQRNGSY